MHPTLRLLAQKLPPHALTITLFTRPNCSLCTTAKDVLAQVWEQRHFEFREVDIMDGRNPLRRAEYEFDVPVIHVQPTDSVDLSPSRTGPIGEVVMKKLMHRFRVEEVIGIMGEVEKEKEKEGLGGS